MADTMADARGGGDHEARENELDVLRSMYPQELREYADQPDLIEVLVPLSRAGPTQLSLASDARQGASVQHLALTLRARLPSDYPSTRAPLFCIISDWIDPATSEPLLQALRDAWEAARPDPVLVSWVEHLRFETAADAAELALRDVEASEAAGADGNAEPVEGGRVVRTLCSARAALAATQRADDAAGLEARGTAITRCGICFDDVLGRECMTFAGCEHTFCSACLRRDLEGRIGRGEAARLGCAGCGAPLRPQEVQQLVGADAYAEYERAALHSSLATMEDVQWCPMAHCQAPVLLDRRTDGSEGYDQLARCAACAFSFCTLCKRSWHGYTPCHDLRRRWERADADERAALTERFGAAVFDDIQSAAWIEASTQACPGCRTSVEKNGGCNHMTCAKCGLQWCWLCRGRYHPLHYVETQCTQFGADFYAEVQQALREASAGDD